MWECCDVPSVSFTARRGMYHLSEIKFSFVVSNTVISHVIAAVLYRHEALCKDKCPLLFLEKKAVETDPPRSI